MKVLFFRCSVAILVIGATTIFAENPPETAVTPSPASNKAEVAAESEETVTMTGVIERQDKGNGNIVRVFIDNATKKRTVMPSLPRQLPESVNLDSFSGEVTITALIWHRERDGKKQAIMKRIMEIKGTGQAPAEPPVKENP